MVKGETPKKKEDRYEAHRRAAAAAFRHKAHYRQVVKKIMAKDD